MVEDEKIVARLQELLGEVNMTQTSERMLREKLEEEFGVDLSDKKALVRSEVDKYLAEHRPPPEDDKGNDDDAQEGEDEEDGEDADDAEVEEEVEENDEEAEGDEDEEEEGVSSSAGAKRKRGKQRKADGQTTKKPRGAAAGKKTRGRGGGKDEEKGKKVEKKGGKGRGGQGFTKPLKVSTALADFLGSAEISRPMLTKKMWAYFKENGLQNPENKQEIISDEKLRSLMNVDRFRGFGFMKHLKHHIVEG